MGIDKFREGTFTSQDGDLSPEKNKNANERLRIERNELEEELVDFFNEYGLDQIPESNKLSNEQLTELKNFVDKREVNMTEDELEKLKSAVLEKVQKMISQNL